jgi:hypothetical protein
VTSKLFLAVGLPTAYLVITTTMLLSGAVTLPPFLQHLSIRRAIAWNAMVGLSIGLGTLRWALNR